MLMKEVTFSCTHRIIWVLITIYWFPIISKNIFIVNMEKFIHSRGIAAHTFWIIWIVITVRTFLMSTTKKHCTSIFAFSAIIWISYTVISTLFKRISVKLRAISTFRMPWLIITILWFNVILCK